MALEASLPLSATAVGGALIALCRAAADESAVGGPARPPAARPVAAPGRRRQGRGAASAAATRRRSTEAIAHWERPPRHLRAAARGRDRGAAPARRSRASPRELAEAPHRERAPLAGPAAGVPFSALELRAGVAAAELLTELAGLGRPARLRGPRPGGRDRGARVGVGAAVARAGRRPGADPEPLPGPRGARPGALRALAPGRRVPERRAAATRCSPRSAAARSATPTCAAHGPGRRGALPVPRLRLAADRAPVSELAGLRRGRHGAGALAVRRRGLRPARPGPDGADEPLRKRGPERAVPALAEATSERDLARALALGGWAFDRRAGARAAGVGEPRRAVEALFADLPDPNLRPGPAALARRARGARRRARSSRANSLEGWVTCSYRWFVEHELEPAAARARRRPALARLDRPRRARAPLPRAAGRRLDPAARRRRRLAAALRRAARARRRRARAAPLNHARRAALARARAQVEAFLAAEARDRDGVPPSPRPARGRLRALRRGQEGAGARAARARRASRCAAGSTGSTSTRPAAPSSATTRPARTSPPADKFTEEGKLQIQLYMRVAERILGLDAGRRASTTRSARSASASRAGSSPARTRTSRGSGSSAPTASSRRLRARARRGRGARARLRRRDAGRRHPPPPDRRASARSTATSSRSAGSSGRSASTRTATADERARRDS